MHERKCTTSQLLATQKVKIYDQCTKTIGEVVKTVTEISYKTSEQNLSQMRLIKNKRQGRIGMIVKGERREPPPPPVRP